EKESNLCSISVEHIKNNPWLFSNFREDEDDVVKLVCQFDLLQCLVLMDEDFKTKESSEAYPSFGVYQKANVEPIVEDLVMSRDSRRALKNSSDDRLAWYIHKLDNYVPRAQGSLWWWDAGIWQRRNTEHFFRKHHAILDKPLPPS
ncbi:MAG: hypothetical protein V3V94_02470, partial [Candidatus Brocadiales bacterium]